MDEFVWSMMECEDCEHQATEDKFLIDQQDEKTVCPECGSAKVFYVDDDLEADDGI